LLPEALSRLNGYLPIEWDDPENDGMRADYTAHAEQVARLYVALWDTYDAEGVTLVLRSWADKAEALAGGPGMDCPCHQASGNGAQQTTAPARVVTPSRTDNDSHPPPLTTSAQDGEL
jgi:hypothetical protein